MADRTRKNLVWDIQKDLITLPADELFHITKVMSSDDDPRMAAVLQAPGKLCSFPYVLFVFLLFYVLDDVSMTVYDRDTLLNIGSSVAQSKPDFEFLNAGGLFTDTASEPFVWVVKSRKRRRRRKKEEKELAFSSD